MTAEAMLLTLQTAAEVEALIDAIGEVTLASEDTIHAARSAYDALSDLQKAYVSNYDVLTAAEDGTSASAGGGRHRKPGKSRKDATVLPPAKCAGRHERCD